MELPIKNMFFFQNALCLHPSPNNSLSTKLLLQATCFEHRSFHLPSRQWVHNPNRSQVVTATKGAKQDESSQGNGMGLSFPPPSLPPLDAPEGQQCWSEEATIKQEPFDEGMRACPSGRWMELAVAAEWGSQMGETESRSRATCRMHSR